MFLLAAFIWHAKRKKENALIDLDLFNNKIFSNAAVTQFLTNGVIYAGQFLIPLFLINGFNLGATQVGWLLVPMGIGMMCIYPFMGVVTDRLGCRAVSMAGAALNVIGTLPFLWMAANGLSLPWTIAGLFLRGFGQGAVGIPTIAAAYSSVSRDKLGPATTAVNIVQRLGGPLATTGIAIAVYYSVAQVPLAHDFITPLVALTILQLAVFAAASRLPIRIHQLKSDNC